ncbi:CRPV-090 [Crowpox virus]|nr:CRPV-090 [Crowpox virus]
MDSSEKSESVSGSPLSDHKKSVPVEQSVKTDSSGNADKTISGDGSHDKISTFKKEDK